MMQDVKIIAAMMLKDCMRFMDDYFYKGLLTGGLAAFFYLLILIGRNFLTRSISRDNIIRKCWKLPFVTLLGLYGHLVLGITILSREKGTKYILNPIPFSTWGGDFWHWTLWIENILMLIPLGILLYILWSPFRKLRWSLLTGFGASLAIESIQFVARLGKFEVDDIMNNVFGMLAGFLFCKGIDRLLFQQAFLNPPKC